MTHVTHSKMLETRRRRKRAKKDFAGTAKRAKNLAKRNAKKAGAGVAKVVAVIPIDELDAGEEAGQRGIELLQSGDGEVGAGPHIGGGIEYWFAYVLALIVLLARPQGLFGERIIERV